METEFIDNMNNYLENIKIKMNDIEKWMNGIEKWTNEQILLMNSRKKNKINKISLTVKGEQDKDDNNKIELFNELFENKSVRIYGDFNNPLFVAKDIGDILELNDIKSTLNKGKYKENIHFLQGGKISSLHPQTKLLTERGLYKIISKSHSLIAEKFEEFIYNLLHNLRTKKISIIENENNQLKQNIKEQKKIIEEQKKKIIDPKTMFYEIMKNKTNITNDECILYIVTTENNERENKYKVGITELSLKTRLQQMKTTDHTIYAKYHIKLNKDVYKHFESIFHNYLDQYKSEGEWFYIEYKKLKKLFNMTKRYADKFINEINDE